jgi:hypothetical protein
MNACAHVHSGLIAPASHGHMVTSALLLARDSVHLLRPLMLLVTIAQLHA